MSNSLLLTQTPSVPVGIGALLAQALRTMGTSGFYESMVEVVRQMIPCDFSIIARYDAHRKPLIVSETGMNVHAKTIYSDRLWRRDPLPHHATESATQVVSLQELRDNGALDTVYSHYLKTALGIEDELALLFPINNGSFLALCLDRYGQVFTEAELALAREMQAVLVEMHHQHILRAVDKQVSLFLHSNGLGKPEILILGYDRTVLYKSDTWSNAALEAFDREPYPGELGCGLVAETKGRNGWSLIRLQENSSDAILTGADIYLLRRNATAIDRVSEFARLHQLTERQQQILALSLQGHPNSSIADKLRISVGGVKNHKLRLYEKLDITSERELLSAVLFSL